MSNIKTHYWNMQASHQVLNGVMVTMIIIILLICRQKKPSPHKIGRTLICIHCFIQHSDPWLEHNWKQQL